MVYIKSDSKQTQLLPTKLTSIIGENHICYLIESFIHELDYSEFDKQVQGAGNPTYHPRILLKILIFGIFERITSSRRLEKATHENIVFRYLAESLNPDFHTISNFRKTNSQLIKTVFLQTIELAKSLDMINLNKLYLDGTKFKANASKNQNFSKEEIEFLSEFVDEQITEADKTDFHENKRYGKKNDGEPKIPKELRNKSKLKEKIKNFSKNFKKAKEELDLAKNNLSERDMDKSNFTDPDSKLTMMKNGSGYKQGYNCQLLVEDENEILVGNYISNSETDMTETVPTMEKFKEEQNCDLKSKQVCSDNGYSSAKTAQYYETEGVDAYIPCRLTTKELHSSSFEIDKFHVDNFVLDFKKNQVTCPAGEIMVFIRKQVNKNNDSWTNIYRTDKCLSCEFASECISGKRKTRDAKINPLMRKIREKFKTEEGRKIYDKRFHKGEIVQAHILHNLGYRNFQTRGLESCENEVNLVSISYNLRKIANFINKKSVSIARAMEKFKENVSLNEKNGRGSAFFMVLSEIIEKKVCFDKF